MYKNEKNQYLCMCAGQSLGGLEMKIILLNKIFFIFHLI